MKPLNLSGKIGHMYHGDCIKVMKSFKDNTFDMVLTDPPYIVNYHDRTGRTIPNDSQGDWLQPAFREIARVLKPTGVIISFYGWNRVDQFMSAWRVANLQPIGHLVFCKEYASRVGLFRHQHENAFVLGKSGSHPTSNFPISDVRHWKYTGNRYHPTQKPVSAMKKLIEAFTQTGDLILDPFMGSGTTLLAAKILKRRSVGIEIDRKFYDVAKNRLQRPRAMST